MKTATELAQEYRERLVKLGYREGHDLEHMVKGYELGVAAGMLEVQDAVFQLSQQITRDAVK